MILSLLLTALSALADPPAQAPAVKPPSVQEKENYGLPARRDSERNFYEVLEDLLSDFETDVKENQVPGLKNMAIKSVSLSENVPVSFKSHLELVVTQRILSSSKSAKIIQCLACRAKKTQLSGNDVVVTNPETNPVELARIAKVQQIEHFLDLAYAYQAAGMVLSMSITDPESGAVLWSKSYNSETSRASAQRRGVDYSQVDTARKAGEYKPTLQYRVSLGFQFEPNVAESAGGRGTGTGCLSLAFRLMERYDNRKKEVGFEASWIKDAGTLVGSTATSDLKNLWSGFNLTVLFMHSWNMFLFEENYNQARGSLFLGVGGSFSPGYLGALFRAGWEWRLARLWAVSGMLGFRPSGGYFDAGTRLDTISGVEFGIGIHYLF